MKRAWCVALLVLALSDASDQRPPLPAVLRTAAHRLHGLANAMRKAMLVDLVVVAIQKHSKQTTFDFAPSMLATMQVAMQLASHLQPSHVSLTFLSEERA